MEVHGSRGLPRPSNVVPFWIWYVFVIRVLIRITKKVLHWRVEVRLMLYSDYWGHTRTIRCLGCRVQGAVRDLRELGSHLRGRYQFFEGIRGIYMYRRILGGPPGVYMGFRSEP